MDVDSWADRKVDPLICSLPPLLQTFLCENGWSNPATLESAFDTEVEAEALIASFTGMHETRATRRFWAKELMKWQLSVASAIRRVRSRITSASIDDRVLCLHNTVKRFSESKERLMDSTIRLMCSPVHWRTRRAAKLSIAQGAQERTEIERREKLRWTERVIAILTEAVAPVVQQAQLASAPELALAAITGKKRSSTIRGRVRAWNKVRLWLQLVLNIPFPLHAGHMIDYLQDLQAGHVAKTFPASVGMALAFMEKVGGYPEAQRISRHPLWLQNLESLTTRLQERAGAMTVMKAPNLSILTIISLEIFVCSGREPYLCILAWCTLLMVWLCLRFDDLQGLSSSRLTLSSVCLRSILGRSKTTGPGKKTGEIPCYCRADASFSGSNWLKIGFGLFRSDRNVFARDYFLPKPTQDFQGFVSGMLDYAYCAALTRKLLLSLKLPVRTAGVWGETVHSIILHPAQMFWSLHSPRHLMPSISAVLRVPADRRNFLGRWGVNSPQQNNDYVLTSRQIVLDVQGEVLKGISQGPSTYDEEDLYDQYRSWLDLRIPGEDPEVQIELLRGLTDKCILNQPWPPILEPIPLDGDDDFGILIPSDPLPPTAFLATASFVTRADQDEELPYWASIGKRGYRRLHRTNGCRTDRLSCMSWVGLSAEAAQRDKSDQACRWCWPDLQEDTGHKTPTASSDDGSEQSESSSSEDSMPEVLPE